MNSGKSRKRQTCLSAVLCWGGLGIGAFGLIFKNAFLGITFLMLFFSAAGFFLAVCGLLLRPAATLRGARRKKCALRVLAALLCVGVLLFAAVELRIGLSADGDGAEAAGPNLIVLGAGLYGETPSAALVSRLEAALVLLEEDPGRIAVLSGGQGAGESVTEASAMARWLVARGVAPDRLILEEQAKNTEQNLRFSGALLEERTGERPLKVTVVSNDFHLYRAVRLAEKLGMEATSFSAPTPRIGLVPLSCRIREFFSVLAMFVRYG